MNNGGSDNAVEIPKISSNTMKIIKVSCLKNDNEILFLNTKKFLYMAKHQVDEGIKYFTERLQDCLPSIKFDIYEMLLELLDVMDYEFIINKIEELIQQEKDKNLKTYLKDALESYKEDY